MMSCIPRGRHGRAGGMAGAFFATNISHYSPYGMEGWRFAFHVVAALSVFLALLLRMFARDPRKKVNALALHKPSGRLACC